jgi:predicted ATP-dependent endonuclease of OLD family
MHISKLIIKGFRCFDTEGVIFNDVHKMNVFLGHNSAGKTTAMEAMLKLFGRTRAEREIRKTDFYRTTDCSNLPDGSRLSIEAQLIFDDNDNTIPLYFNSLLIDCPQGKPYIRIRLEATWKNDPRNAEGIVDTDVHYLINPETDDSIHSVKRSLKSVDYSRFQLYYIPAVRKTSDELKYTSNSLMHKILKLISYDAAFQANTSATFKQVDTSIQQKEDFKIIKAKLIEKWSDFHKDSRYDDVEIGILCDDIEQFLKKLEVTFTSNNPSGDIFQINDLGDGYKSLFYLTMICTLLEAERQLKSGEELPLLSILTIEEPENHIAPHLLGKISKIFEKMSNKNFLQIFISSHSASLVGRIQPEFIYHFLNKDQKTSVHQITMPAQKTDGYKFLKEAVHHWPEIYFAKLVVIGEGDSEEVIFKYLSEHLDTNFDENEITFFPLGHRFIHHIWDLLKQLKIPHITLLDLDRERPGGGWGRIKYILQELKLHSICDDNFWNNAPKKFDSSEIEDMHSWIFSEPQHSADELSKWISYLENYNVFFSSPLDIDYLMLQTFADEYKKKLSEKEKGPYIPDKASSQKYIDYLDKAIKATLKGEDTDKDDAEEKSPQFDGSTYNEHEKELMIWYKYLFLGKGKPLIHILHLPNIPDTELKGTLGTTVLKRIFDKIEELLND